MTKPALALLASLDRVEGQTRLFPELGPNALLDCLHRLEPDKTVHGFRSSFRDWAGDETNFAREVIEETIGHKVGDDTENAYRRGTAMKKRKRVLDAWSSFVTGKQQDNILAFKSR
ncbi:hypothetical protein [Phyllobacterium bourgognense]|uniref:hypothetical protein n=1 Tax=Phyllobacterium bourgognense TaxID=314236 RepID=UPI000DF40686|nr:hypothetical protein [Phyllobacterium bourgognense]